VVNQNSDCHIELVEMSFAGSRQARTDMVLDSHLELAERRTDIVLDRLELAERPTDSVSILKTAD